MVSDQLVAKFKGTEKETPYTRFIASEGGLDIVNGNYVPSLHEIELKPWARGARRENAVFINHRRIAHHERLPT